MNIEVILKAAAELSVLARHLTFPNSSLHDKVPAYVTHN